MIFAFDGRRPKIGKGTYISPTAQVIGDVQIGENCYVGPGSILRGDYGTIQIGEGTAVEEAVVIHAPPNEVCQIGSRVTLGHGAIIHSACIGDHALIGMGAITSLGARVGSWTLVAEGAVVKRGQDIPDHVVVAGAPAKIVRPINEKEKAYWTDAKQLYVDLAAKYLEKGLQPLEQSECI